VSKRCKGNNAFTTNTKPPTTTTPLTTITPMNCGSLRTTYGIMSGINNGTAFDSLINTEYINKNIKLFIDSTFINNKYGVEDIGLNIDNKKKRASKLSIICNENKFILSYSLVRFTYVLD
jgi:hypothetical protein